MPVKFKESENKVVNRRVVGKKHYYMLSTSTEELLKAFENDKQGEANASLGSIISISSMTFSSFVKRFRLRSSHWSS